jgi:hypothetical protein
MHVFQIVEPESQRFVNMPLGVLQRIEADHNFALRVVQAVQRAFFHQRKDFLPVGFGENRRLGKRDQTDLRAAQKAKSLSIRALRRDAFRLDFLTVFNFPFERTHFFFSFIFLVFALPLIKKKSFKLATQPYRAVKSNSAGQAKSLENFESFLKKF